MLKRLIFAQTSFKFNNYSFCELPLFQPLLSAQGQLASWSAVTSQIHTSAALCRVVSGKYRITKKRDRPLTYEMANPPHYIAHRKTWNSWNTCMYFLHTRLFAITFCSFSHHSFLPLVVQEINYIHYFTFQQILRMGFVGLKLQWRMSLSADS